MDGELARAGPRIHRRHISKRMVRVGGARRKLLALVVLLVAAVGVLPIVVFTTPLRNTVLSAALPSQAIRVTAQGGSFSWVGGCSLSGVQVTDAAGNVLLTADKIGIDRPPLSLAMNPRDLGTLEIVQPTLYVKTRSDGSNIEDAVNKLVADLVPSAPAAEPQAGTASQSIPSVNVRLIGGTVVVDDTTSGAQLRLEKFDALYESPGAVGGLGRGAMTGQVVAARAGEPQAAAGQFTIKLGPIEGGQEQLSLQVAGFSMAAAAPWLQRYLDQAQISGILSGNGVATWTAGQASPFSGLTTSGMLAVDRLDVAAPALAGDRLRLVRAEMPWKLAADPSGIIVIQDCQLRSEIGQVALRGRLDPKLQAERNDVELRAALDVARLAGLLPHAMRIRSDTTITSGTLEVAGRLQPQESGQLITGSLRTAQLAATSAGRPFRWDDPVNAKFALRRTGETMQLDSLRCDSTFLKIEASGSAQQFAANTEFDLNRLAEQLAQLIDLRGIQLAGTGSAKLSWQQAEGDSFSAKAVGQFSQLAISLPDGAVWAEPQLSILADAAGAFDAQSRRPTRVDSAKLQIDGQGDALDAQLTGAVALTDQAAAWPVTVRASGNIARWLTRTRPWFAPGDWQIDGQGELTTTLRVAGNAAQATDTKLVITGLSARSTGWNITEPRVELTGDARWDGPSNAAAASMLQLVTSTVSLRAQDVNYRAGAQSISQLTGGAAFRADLARIAAWRVTDGQPAQYQPRGELTGSVRFAQQAGRITGELNANGQNLVLMSRSPASRGVPVTGGYDTIWQDPKLTLRGVANYEPTSDRLLFDQFQIQSSTLQAVASGAIEKLSTDANCNLTGTLNYDLAQVTPLLRPYIGNGIQLAGREQARFAVAGKLADENGPQAQLTNVTGGNPYGLNEPSTTSALQAKGTAHWSRRVRAQLELPWTGANVYGLPVGAGRLAASLGDGAIRVEPLSLAVGEGTLTAAPNVRFDPQPAELTLPAGPLLTNVRISAEVSEAMLKYVAPILAGSTQSEGQFSMQLDGTRVPLADTKRSDAAGRLTVHSVRVVPGPMAREIIGMAQQVEALAKRRDPSALVSKQLVTLLSIRDQDVNFRVVDGRVHHQNMEFQLGDITVRSQGSVGMDETLNLMLQVPIQDAWVAKEPLLAGLKGQSLQVPVSGTLSRPQIDQRVIANLSGQMIQNAAGQAIGGEVNKALDKLFKSR